MPWKDVFMQPSKRPDAGYKNEKISASVLLNMLVSQNGIKETVSRDFHTIVFDHSILYPICYECTKIIIIFVDWSWSRTAPSEVFLALRLLEKLYVTRRCPIDLASRTAFSFNWMLSSAALSCGKLNAVMDRAQLAVIEIFTFCLKTLRWKQTICFFLSLLAFFSAKSR